MDWWPGVWPGVNNRETPSTGAVSPSNSRNPPDRFPPKWSERGAGRETVRKSGKPVLGLLDNPLGVGEKPVPAGVVVMEVRIDEIADGVGGHPGGRQMVPNVVVGFRNKQVTHFARIPNIPKD